MTPLTRKHGGAKRRLSRKIQIGVNEETLEIGGIEITGSNVGDAPMMPELLSQIPLDVEIGPVTAYGAYDTRKCHDAVADRDAMRSYRRARTPDPGSHRPRAPSPGTRPCAGRNTSTARFGKSGPAITAEAGPRRRCIA